MSDNKGSDLDVFEGLAKKPADSRRSSVAPPPPAPPSRSGMPVSNAPPPPRRMQTQMGLGIPQLPVPGAPPPPPNSRAGAPPAPPPASRVGRPVPPPAPPPGNSMRGSNANANPRGAMVDMDWDDDDEKTHVYMEAAQAPAPVARGSQPGPAPQPSGPSTGRPPPPPQSASMRSSAPMPPTPPTTARSVPPPPAARANQTLSSGVNPMMSPLPAPAPAPAPAAPPAAVVSAPAQPPVAAQPPAAVAPKPMVDATQVIAPARGGSSKGIIIGGLLVAALAGASVFFYMSSRPGTINVTVNLKAPKGTKLSVLLDGQPKCSDSPCRIDNVEKGSRTIKVVAGDVEKLTPVTVEPGKETQATVDIEIAAKKPVLKIAKMALAGVKVQIDGGEAKTLPYDDDSLTAGAHKLKFVGPSDQYDSKEISVTLEDGQIKNVGSDEIKLALKSIKGKIGAIPADLKGKGLKVLLNDGSKNIDVKEDGMSVDLDPAKKYTLTASAKDLPPTLAKEYEDLNQPLKLTEEPEQTFSYSIAKKGAAPATSATVATTATGAPVGTGTGAPVVTSSNDAALTVIAKPFAACVVNGVPRGRTPFTIKVPPGTYNVTCKAVVAGESFSKSQSVSVLAGEKAQAFLKLRE